MNASSNGTLVKASDKQVAANRANARKSTGPTSRAGKFAVARNGIGHGIYAMDPVIAGVESPRDWKRYREAMLSSLQPANGLETVLAERIALNGWRQMRTSRYETEQIRLTQEATTEVVGVRVGFEHDSAATAVEEIISLVEANQQTWQTVRLFTAADDDTILSQEDAENLLWNFCEQIGFTSEGFEHYWQELPEPLEVWTAGVIRQLVRTLAEQRGKDFDELVQAVHEKTTAKLVQSGREGNKLKHAIDDYRRENLLPDHDTLEKVMRYESHLSRLFQRDLHELQRLQAMRQGVSVAAPIAIDIDVTSGPKPGTDATE